MKGAFVSAGINFIAVLLLFTQGEKEVTGVTITALFFVILSICGTILYKMTRKEAYGIAATVGFVVFIPIGLIGALSVRNQMDRDLRTRFHERHSD